MIDEPRFNRLSRLLAEPKRYQDRLTGLVSASIRGHVRFLGPVAHSRTPDLLEGADLVVFPAIWDEPFGLPVIEAMASGLPVISTRVGGIPETVEDGQTGILVEPDNPTQLASAINDLLDDPARRRRMGLAGRRRACHHFSWKTQARRWLALYANLVGV